MKLTIKLFLVIVIAASTVFADDGNLGNGGIHCDGNLGNGGITCTVECEPLETCEPNPDGATSQPTGENSDDDSVVTIIGDYLTSLLG